MVDAVFYGIPYGPRYMVNGMYMVQLYDMVYDTSLWYIVYHMV